MRMSIIRTSTQMNRRHFLAGFINKNNYMNVAQFSTRMPWIRPIQYLKFGRMATSSFGLNGKQTCQFWPTKIIRNSSGIASSIPELDVQEEEATAKNEEFPAEKEEMEQQEKPLEEAEKQMVMTEPSRKEKAFGRCLAYKLYPNKQNEPGLQVEYLVGKSGQKVLRFRMKIGNKFHSFSKILMPEDVFGFVRAMDGVLKELHAKKNIIEASTNPQERLVLHVANAKGENYDYRLELFIQKKIVFVQMQKMANESTRAENKPRYVFLTLHQFHWLRQAIGELFVANGEQNVQQQLGKPLGYPDWLNPCIASSMPTLDVQEEEATAKNEEFRVEKPEIEQEGKQVEETEREEGLIRSSQPIDRLLAYKELPMKENEPGILIKYKVGKSGQRTLKFHIKFGSEFCSFSKISVPQDVFAFVRAMDQVLKEVHAKKSIIQASHNPQSRLVLHTAKAKGVFYDYLLELYMFNNTVFVRMESIANETTRPGRKPRYVFLSLHQFHWLRQAIGELFAANGEENVQQQLGKPLEYPDWLNPNGVPLAFSSNARTKQQQKQPIAAQDQPQLQSQRRAMLQQLLQRGLQQQQQLQAESAVKNENLGFGAVVPRGSDQIILMSELLAQQQQQQQTMHNNQFDQTAMVNLLAQFQQSKQPMASTINNNNHLTNLVNLLLQNNSGQRN